MRAPVRLKLVRDGSTFTGYYATGDGTWHEVGTAGDVPGTRPDEDAGVFTLSHSPGQVGQAGFSGWSVVSG